ncbi:MAG: hypothetical protein OEV91_05710 [Desulfobulbaceae bacterium]|nr:hypothetical protein [Desulfobulbaceae bacterium]
MDRIKVWLKGIIIACPMGEALPGCPARELRLLPLEERLRLVDELDFQVAATLVHQHQDCLRQREGA